MVQETKSSNRTLIIILAIGALFAAFVVMGAVLLFVLGSGSDEGITADAAKLMPADTLIFFSMNPDLPAAENFDVIRQAWGDVPGFAKVVDNWPAALFEETKDLDYAVDIEPWLGDELAVSISGDLFAALGGSIDQTFAEIEDALSGDADLPMDAMPAIPQFIIAIATTDTDESAKFLEKLRAESDTAMQETDYEGVTIVYGEPESGSDVGVAYATVDGFIVVVGGGVETLQAVIDAKDGDSLADDETYKKVIEALPKGSVGFGYMNLGSFMDGLMGTLEEMSGAMNLAELGALGALGPDQLTAVQGGGFAFGFDPNGIRFDAVSVYDKDALPEDLLTKVNPNEATRHAPADTLAYLSGIDLGGALSGLLDMLGTMPDMGVEDLQESMDMLEAQLGFEVDDLFTALSGEFSLALTQDAAGIMGDPSLPLGLLVQFENKDEATFKQLMSLVGMLTMGIDIELDTTTISDVSVTTVNGPTGEPMIGWGLSDDFFALGTSHGLLETTFGGGDVLADDANFKAAIAPLPSKNTGYFYLNVAGAMDIAYQMASAFEQDGMEEARSFLGPIKAISGASESVSREKGSASATFFILLGD